MRRQPYVIGHTYLVPIALSVFDVRILPFVAGCMDGQDVTGVATLPDGTHADVSIPLSTLRRHQ